jgi:GNAT superfamily N-acetyltransferase
LTHAPFTIRAATASDVESIVAFIRELAEYERLEHEVVATSDSIRQWLFGARPAAEVLIAEIAGEAVGFALFFTSFSTFLAQPGIYLEDLFVRPAHRGAGIGRALLQRVAELACERGCGRLEWAVLDWNEPAIGFYERLGAKAMGEWTTWRVTGEALEVMARPKA